MRIPAAFVGYCIGFLAGGLVAVCICMAATQHGPNEWGMAIFLSSLLAVWVGVMAAWFLKDRY